MDDEGLLVERIGVTGVAILIAGGLQEADGREVAGVDRIVEVVHVVLVIGGIASWPIGGNGGGTRMGRIGGRLVVLERLVMRNVVGLVGVGDERSRAALRSRWCRWGW